MCFREGPIREQVRAFLATIWSEAIVGVADTANWSGRNEIPGDGCIKSYPFCQRGPAWIVWEAAAGGGGAFC